MLRNVMRALDSKKCWKKKLEILKISFCLVICLQWWCISVSWITAEKSHLISIYISFYTHIITHIYIIYELLFSLNEFFVFRALINASRFIYILYRYSYTWIISFKLFYFMHSSGKTHIGINGAYHHIVFIMQTSGQILYKDLSSIDYGTFLN